MTEDLRMEATVALTDDPELKFILTVSAEGVSLNVVGVGAGGVEWRELLKHTGGLEALAEAWFGKAGS